MSREIRNKDEVLEEIKNVVATPGFIYPLLAILFEDFHIDPEQLHSMDHWKRLNMNEAYLLVGFLIKKQIDFTYPESIDSFFEMKRTVRKLMEELHHSLHKPFFEQLEKDLRDRKSEPSEASFQDFFARGDMLVEPIFYAGTGVYDFQYLEFLPKKYDRDEKWLKEKKGFVCSEAVEIFKKIKKVVHTKSRRVHLHFTDLDARKEEALKTYEGNDFEKDYQVLCDMIELQQYADLFFDETMETLPPGSEEFFQEGLKNFYTNLVDLFTIKKSQLQILTGGNDFISNFSVKVGDPLCTRFSGIGDYNVAASNPLIQIEDDKFLLPIPFILSAAIYEAPFYWMLNDPAYNATAAKNRGEVGEEIVFDFLSKVFGKMTFKSVIVKTGKNQFETDIDVFCILGSKALCVQVKSKKLTELSRKGNDDSLKKDFQGAVQDAYEQAWVARDKILNKSSRFYDKDEKEIILPEGIDEVYMLVVTTENYPSLTHMTQSFIKLKEGSPSPLSFTAFDLELITHYLNDPFEFIYYIRQRVTHIEYFRGQEEMVFLGYHIQNKLWKDENASFMVLDDSFAQAIDRNYYPSKAGIKVSDDGDLIKSRWKDESFDSFCEQIKKISHAKVTDIIFHLFDLSGNFRTQLMKLIQDTKSKTLKDGKFHSVAIPPDEEYKPRLGITYFSSETDSLKEVEQRLSVLCNLRKYASRADVWIGFGSLKSSKAPFDFILYNYKQWEFDKTLEEHVKLLPSLVKSSYLNVAQNTHAAKVGRNDPCPCGSSKKYKKCCL